MFHLIPADPSVAVDSATGRPRQLRLDGVRLPVTGVVWVRDETAAYPADAGPRTVFVVDAGGRRFRLIHRLRDRRWLVEELARDGSRLRRAA